jgi:hypothetical protein
MEYGRAVADLIRAERHDLAEDMLMFDLSSLSAPLAKLCLETRTDPVELTNWTVLQQMIFRPTRSGDLCTAVTMDLSNYALHPQEKPEELVEPTVEVGFLTDSSFPFSTSSREEILAQNETYGVPWHGYYEFTTAMISELGTLMSVVGLARLNSAVELDKARYARSRAGQPGVPADYVAYRLAEWLRALRYHKAVKRYLDQEGLARRIPVIVGSHDVGPFLEAVYYPAPSRESAEEAKVRMIEGRDAQRRREQQRELRRTADSMRERRQTIREMRSYANPSLLKKVRRLYELEEALVARTHPLGLPRKPSWRIDDDAEFEQFLKEYYVDAFNLPTRRRLSSRQTFLAKFVIPGAFLAAAVVSLLIALPLLADKPSLLNVLITLVLIAVIISPCSVYIPLKAVSLDGPYLRISNFWKEMAIPLSDVKHVEYVQRFKLKYVVLTLKRRSEFGRQIKFVPPGTWKFWKEHEVVDQLKRLIKAED